MPTCLVHIIDHDNLHLLRTGLPAATHHEITNEHRETPAVENYLPPHKEGKKSIIITKSNHGGSMKNSCMLLILSLGVSASSAFATYLPLDVENGPIVHDTFPKEMFAQQIPNEQLMTFAINSELGRINVAIDGKSSGVFIESGNRIIEFSFSEFASHTYPENIQARNSLISDLQFISTDTSGIVEFQSRSDDWRDAPLGNIGGACAFSPCDPGKMERYNTNSIYWTARSPNNINFDPSYGGFSADIIAYDKIQFDAAKKSACDDETSGTILFTLSGVGVVAGCLGGLAGSTINEELGFFGGLACAGSVAGMAASYSKVKSSTKLCHTKTYPGPGKWSR